MRNCALITGSTGGLGKAYVERCAYLGYDLVLTATKQERLDKLKAEIRSKYNVNVWTKSADLSDEKSRDELFAFLKSNKIEVNILINNAGYIFEGSFLGCENSEIMKAIQVNIIGTMDLTHKFLSLRNQERQNYVLFVSSLAGFTPMPQMATYASTKAYLTSFAIALREEMRGKKVNVTVVCPGGMATSDAMKKSIKAQGLSGKLSAQPVEKIAKGSIDRLLKNKPMYIAGWFNHLMKFTSSIPSRQTVAKFVSKRWTKSQKKQGIYR